MNVEDKARLRTAMDRLSETQRILAEIDWDALTGKEPGLLGSVRVYLNNAYSKLKGINEQG